MTQQSQAYHPGAQTVARAIAVLKCFTDAQPQLSLAEVALATRLNKATAYRMLAALEKEGLVARQGEAYQLGPEAIVLGGRALRATTLYGASQAELVALAAASGESASLEALVGHEVVILNEVASARLLGAMPSIGTRWAAHATSTGKAILAQLPAAELELLLARPLAAFTPHTLALPALREQLAQVRARGYATVRDELEVGYAAVAASIHDHQGRPVAAVCLGGPSVRLIDARLAELAGPVAQAAARISERLGYREAEPRTKN